MNQKNCNLCSFLLVLFAIFVIMGLVYYNKYFNKKNINNIESFEDNIDVPTENPITALYFPNSPSATSDNNSYEEGKVQYVRPITNEEFEQIFRDFYQNASKLAITTKKMKEIMNEYQTVYEENAKIQEEFNRLKDELQNGIKALG